MEGISMDQKADEIIEKAGEFFEKLKEQITAKKGFIGLIIGIFTAIPDVVKLVELLGLKDGASGATKKCLAVTILNKIINIPILTESMEYQIIGSGVDVVVGTFNKLFGKKWLNKMSNPMTEQPAEEKPKEVNADSTPDVAKNVAPEEAGKKSLPEENAQPKSNPSA